VLRQAGRHFGVGLASALNLLNPERIVVGGEAVDQAGELLLEPARGSLRRHAFSVLADDVEVVAAELGADAWVVGAATLILEEFFRSPVAQPAANASGVAVSRVYAAVR
jgi:predicted NBD/HSP70 family sugar kinase